MMVDFFVSDLYDMTLEDISDLLIEVLNERKKKCVEFELESITGAHVLHVSCCRKNEVKV